MPDANYINLNNKELDKPVYRIMPINRLFESFKKNSLVVMKPKLWDDPFENLLLSSKVLIGGEVGAMSSIRDSVYGLCWTLHRETDAMWRIYSSDKNGAKVKTTPRKLLEALQRSDSFPDIQCFIGKVKYLSQKDLVSQLKGINPLDTTGRGIAQSLLYKRKEFVHEKEVRLIFHHNDNKNGDVYPFDIDPNFLFEDIVFDPRMNPDVFDAFRDSLKAKGFPPHKIRQSKLYQPPRQLTLKY